MLYTTQAIQGITGRKIKYVKEMAYVVLAVFESGRPKFVSKGKISCEVLQWDCGWMSEGFSKEWQIKPQRFKKNIIKKSSVNPLEAYKLAVSLGCNVREDWWTPANLDKAKIVIRRPSDEQLAILVAADANWDTKWGIYPISGF